ncbi:MAG: hypothetical protein E6848_28470, partial [Bradyrhizobium sp.]|nr:hypothetical protein [Bradyrhizobium sp.]
MRIHPVLGAGSGYRVTRRFVVQMQQARTTCRRIVKSPKKAADAALFCFTCGGTLAQIASDRRSRPCLRPGGPNVGLMFEIWVMGIFMKKLALLATALAMMSGSASAADMAVKALKAPPAPAFDPWDIAFGAAIMNDYVFRGITQSNHKPSVAAYFEPRFNVNKD